MFMPSDPSSVAFDAKNVFILGMAFNSITDLDSISNYIKSRLWMTYRKGFSPIGSKKGPKCDSGWGCMHRCGQMILAEAMSRIHLGSEWKLSSDTNNPDYYRMLNMFQDRKSALYSIHNITLTGVSLDKQIGSWFGPNTVAHVVKKLSVYDQWTNLVVHVSIEEGIIIDELKSLCYRVKSDVSFTGDQQQKWKNDEEEEEEDHSDSSRSPFVPYFFPPGWNEDAIQMQTQIRNDYSDLVDVQLQLQLPITQDLDDDCVEIISPPIYSPISTTTTTTIECSSTKQVCDKNRSDDDDDDDGNREAQDETRTIDDGTGLVEKPSLKWRPLLLFISIRIGLQSPNPFYFETIKSLFKIPQFIGILGGRPCHAVWMIGYCSCTNQIICLDPHSTQNAHLIDTTPVPLNSCCSMNGGDGDGDDDDDATGVGSIRTPSGMTKFHTDEPICLSLSSEELDPSMVVGFLCRTELEFDQLCASLDQNAQSHSDTNSSTTTTTTDASKLNNSGCSSYNLNSKWFSLIEIHPTRPAYMPPSCYMNMNHTAPSNCSPNLTVQNSSSCIKVNSAGGGGAESIDEKEQEVEIKEDSVDDVQINLDSDQNESTTIYRRMRTKWNQLADGTVRYLFDK